METFVFYFIAFCTCVFALLTVTSRNIFHNAVWLALTLLSVSGIYFYLDAQFLGVIQVLVYIGGIITLFVFAIMLTADIGDTSIRQINQQVFVAGVAALALFLFLLKMIHVTPWKALPDAAPPSGLPVLGVSLLTKYLLPFEFLSVLLLAAMVGAIVIGKVKR